MRSPTRGHAVLLGDGPSVAAPLAAAGVPVTVVCGRVSSTRFSRYAAGWLPNPRPDEDRLIDLLLDHASRTPEPLVLFYQQDEDLLLLSRRREELAAACRFVVPDPGLVEQLVDKGGFQELADRLDLPVPPAHVVDLTQGVPSVAVPSAPLLVKPVQRDRAWNAHSAAKAVLVDGPGDLQPLLEELASQHSRVLVQELVPGAEDRVESYHVYVDSSGEIAGEFTGRKLRTRPASFGHTTALVTTSSEDVAGLGREITQRLGLRGVAKLDFKRDPDDRLWLFEVNPRFNLWHHAGAVAGVNIPALVWADLTGATRPPRRSARAGVTWCKVERDWLAARQEGMALTAWLRWLASCDTRAFGDPTRLLRRVVPRTPRRSLPGVAEEGRV